MPTAVDLVADATVALHFGLSLQSFTAGAAATPFRRVLRIRTVALQFWLLRSIQYKLQ